MESFLNRAEKFLLKKKKTLQSNNQAVIIERFLFENKGFFINHFSYLYPLGEHLLKEFKCKWNWELLSSNENLYWSIDLIEKFKDRWHWESLSGNESLPWSDELIFKYANKWYWQKANDWGFSLSDNNSVKWSYNILKRHPEKIDWDMISIKADILNKYPDIFRDFFDKLDWDSISGNEEINFSEELIDKFASFWNWDYLSGNRAIDWTEESIDKYKSMFNFERYREGNDELWLNIKYTRSLDKESDNQTISEHIEAEKIDSTNPNINESEQVDQKRFITELKGKGIFELIESNKEHLDWEGTSLDRSIPWSIELIERYKDKWEWGHEETDKDGRTTITFGLTSNPKLPWSADLIRKFQDYWYWSYLSYSEFVPWSLELINEFEDKWDWSGLVSNQTLWQKVFYPYIDPSTIRRILNS